MTRRVFITKETADSIGFSFWVFTIVVGIAFGLFFSNYKFQQEVNQHKHIKGWRQTTGYVTGYTNVVNPKGSSVDQAATIKYVNYIGELDQRVILIPHNQEMRKAFTVDVSRTEEVYVPAITDEYNSMGNPFKAYKDGFYPQASGFVFIVSFALVGLVLSFAIAGGLKNRSITLFSRAPSAFGMRKATKYEEILVHLPDGNFVHKEVDTRYLT